MPKGEWRLAGVMGVAERPADNGLGALNSPGFGFETEPSGEPWIERIGAKFVRGFEGAGQER